MLIQGTFHIFNHDRKNRFIATSVAENLSKRNSDHESHRSYSCSRFRRPTGRSRFAVGGTGGRTDLPHQFPGREVASLPRLGLTKNIKQEFVS